MFFFLPLLLLELFIAGSLVFFCLSCLVSGLRAARAKRYSEAVACLSPPLFIAIFFGIALVWINH